MQARLHIAWERASQRAPRQYVTGLLPVARGAAFNHSIATRSFFQSLRIYIIMEFHSGLPVHLAVVGISQAIDYYRKYRERELQASNLETRLAEAQLDALRMQLHPHFLLPSAFHPAIQPLRPAETVVYPKSVSDFVDSAYRARA